MQNIILKARDALAIYTDQSQKLAEAREKRERLSRASSKPITEKAVRELAEAKAMVDLLESRESSLDSIVAPVVDECNELMIAEVERLKRIQSKLDLAALRAAADDLIRQIERGEAPQSADFDLRNSPQYKAEHGMRIALGFMGNGGIYLPHTHTRADIVRALNDVIHAATNIGVAKARTETMAVQHGIAA